jgi:glyoxylase-like metal-dependent hydrolase (beta-lactamase superfamily II)
MLSAKRLFVIVLALCFSILESTVTNTRARSESEVTGVVLKWLGNAGWEIQIGETIVLIDPFLTRGLANPGKEWKTDEEAVLKTINRAEYIFAGHSHADHIADIPFLTKKFAWQTTGVGL